MPFIRLSDLDSADADLQDHLPKIDSESAPCGTGKTHSVRSVMQMISCERAQ